MSIKNDHTLHPITALDLFQDQDGSLLILAGEGPYLKVFEAKTSRLINQCRVFEGQTIHGIAVREAISKDDALQVIIWGGSSLFMFTRADVHKVLRQDLSTCPGAASVVSDWILDAKISPYDDGSSLLVTAHNTVLRATLTGQSVVGLEELHSPSRSILYSAHLDWASPTEVLVAAGTVFGEIIAWKCSTTPQDATQSEGEVLFTFTGHEGSIFGVNISPLIACPDQSTRRFIASCSDDRTIRVWDISTASFARDSNQGSTAARETGFGNIERSNEHKCIAMAMGHTSRIWRVKFLVESTGISDLVNILSFGEDSTTQQWSLDFETSKPGKSMKQVISSIEVPNADAQISAHLTNQKISAFHSGKHIWSAATRRDNDGRTMLATGGSDGKISLYPVQMYGHEQTLQGADYDGATTLDQPASDGSFRSSWSTEEVFDLIPSVDSSASLYSPPVEEQIPAEELSTENPDAVSPKKKKPKKTRMDTFSRYAFTSESQFVVTTTFGRILIGDLEGGLTWKELFLPESGSEDLKSWSVVKSLPEAGLIFLAGANGKIYASKGSKPLLEVGCVEGKVTDMFVVSNPAASCAELLVTTLSASSVKSFAIDQVSIIPSFTGQFSYDLPPKFVVTSAGRSGDCLVLGSRYGSLAIYDSERHLVHVEDSHDALNGDAITSIIPMTSDRDDRIYFLITGRKGAYLIFRLSLEQNSGGIPLTKRLSLVHQGSPPFGPMIEQAWFSESDVILYGFKSKNFIVWNETQQYEIMSVECGGAHRSYAYSPTKQGGHFIYTKASRLYIYSQFTPSHKIIKSGGHGREIKACAVSEDRNLIATGAEDTAIRIWSYDDSGDSLQNQFKCLAVVQKHTAGIQHLQWHKSSYLFSSGGIEEFCIWAVEALPNFGIGIMCEATCPDQSEDCDLRIMSFDVMELPSETGVRFLISLAYSDSTIRVYTYEKEVGYGLVARGRYTSSCLMQIRNLKVDEAGGLLVLTAATDGYLALWRASVSASGPEEQTLLLTMTRKVHQSSIKSLDIISTPVKDQILVATGGDDNALAISLFTLTDPNSSVTPKSFILRAAHAAAVTGLTFIPDTSRDASRTYQDFRILSSSNDQRVKEWNIRLRQGEAGDELEVQIRKVGDVFTPVADVGDVACLRSGDRKKALVVGNGMEVWKVSDDQSHVPVQYNPAQLMTEAFN